MSATGAVNRAFGCVSGWRYCAILKKFLATRCRLSRSIVVQHEPKEKDVYDYRSKLPFVKYDGGRSIVWWNVTPTGKWVADFKLGREYALKFWEVCGSGRAFALEFQLVILGMLTRAKTCKDAGYSALKTGFLPAVGELAGGATHINALLQDYDARARRTSLVDDL